MLRDDLNTLDEKKDWALLRKASYQQSAASYYNSMVRSQTFNKGDLLLRKFFQNIAEPNIGKLGANWVSPYCVSKVVCPGVYLLETLYDIEVLRSWNAEHLRKYYMYIVYNSCNFHFLCTVDNVMAQSSMLDVRRTTELRRLML